MHGLETAPGGRLETARCIEPPWQCGQIFLFRTEGYMESRPCEALHGNGKT